jgi:hypothetical protein
MKATYLIGALFGALALASDRCTPGHPYCKDAEGGKLLKDCYKNGYDKCDYKKKDCDKKCHPQTGKYCRESCENDWKKCKKDCETCCDKEGEVCWKKPDLKEKCFKKCTA